MIDIRRNPLGWLIVLAIMLAFAAQAIPAQADDDDDDGDGDGYVPGEVVVKLVQATDLPAVAAQYGLNPVPIDQFGTRSIFRLQILDGELPPAKAERLASDPRVQYAEPNYLGQTPEGRQRASWAKGGDEGEYAAQWAPSKIRLPEAHLVSRGAGVTVAVLDTGVDLSHPALAGRLVAGYDFVDNDADPREEGVYGQDISFGHGTHVTGLVALAAPDAKIMPLRALEPDGVGNIWVLSEAMLYAVERGADVINLSLGITRSTELLEDIIEDITCSDRDDDDDDDGDHSTAVLDEDDDCLDPDGRGVVIVATAGNNGNTVKEYPAAEDEEGLLAIAASTQNDTLASFSTRGTWVHASAPGEQILSSVPGGEYGSWSGTSMAAPLAAGQAALIRSAEPGLSAVAVAARIQITAFNIGAGVPPRVDAAAALGMQ